MTSREHADASHAAVETSESRHQEKTALVAHVCATCGAQYPLAAAPPAACRICSDPRQFVGLDGQEWTTLEQLRARHNNVFVPEEPGVQSMHTEPAFAIGERSFLIQAGGMNILWDCITLIDQATVERIRSLGGIQAIAVSHPHYYTAMVEWSAAFGNAPVYVHAADRDWVTRPHENLRFWSGDTLGLHDGLTLIHTPGHFDGFQVLHWRDGAEGKGALFCADQPQVCMDTRWLSFMYSYPNLIPLGPAEVRNIVDKLEPWQFDRIYGAFPKRTVETDAKGKLRSSAKRFLGAIQDSRPLGGNS